MKFNNLFTSKAFLLINSFLLIFVFLCLSFFLVFFSLSRVLLIVIPLISILIILIYNLIITNKIELDSTSEVLTIVISHPFVKKYIHNAKIVTEFPKKRLVKYKIKRNLLRSNLKISFLREDDTKASMHHQSFNFFRLSNAQQLILMNELSQIIGKNHEHL